MVFPLYDEQHTNGRTGARVTACLIMANMFVFFLQVLNNVEFTKSFSLLPSAVTQSCWTLLTHCFMHGGFWHLAGNMWYLWVFGDNVEDHMGSWNFLFFYLVCGLLSGLAECVLYPGSKLVFLGASGAISGVLAAYWLLFPKARIRTHVALLWFQWMPAWFLLGGWFLLQLLSQMMDSTMSAGVSFIGHIAGFVAGYLLCSLFFREETA